MERIREVYDRWSATETFSHRPWSNVEAKIREVYEENMVIRHGGSRGGSGRKNGDDDRVAIVAEILAKRKL